MNDVTIELEHRPGALATMGETLGRAGVSVEGGGVFLVNGMRDFVDVVERQEAVDYVGEATSEPRIRGLAR